MKFSKSCASQTITSPAPSSTYPFNLDAAWLTPGVSSAVHLVHASSSAPGFWANRKFEIRTGNPGRDASVCSAL